MAKKFSDFTPQTMVEGSDELVGLRGSVNTRFAANLWGTSQNLGDSLTFQAYDVNNTTYRTFIVLTANNTPSCVISAPSGGTLNIDGATLGANSPITISNSTSITVTTLINTGGETFAQKDYTATLAGPAYTMSTANGHSQAYTITGDVVITVPSLPSAGIEKEILVEIIMDGSGGHTVTFSGATYAAGVAPTIATGANAVTHLSFKGTPRAWTLFASYAP